jgi:hypothetical protein
MLHNVHVLPGPAVDVAIDHDLVLTVAWYPLHPGFEHAEKHPPHHGHIADILLQDLLSLSVDLEAFVPIELCTPLFQQGIKLGVGPCLAPATGEFGIEGVVVFVVRIRIIGKPADEDELQIELPESLTEDARFENLELGVHVEMLGKHGLDSLSHGFGSRTFFTHRQREPGPVFATFVFGAL